MRQPPDSTGLPHLVRRSLSGLPAMALAAATVAHAQLVPNDPFLLTQQSIGALEEVDDRFGSTLAAGDFDGDGASDLAVGVPLEGVSSIVDGGAVYLVYGTRTASGGAFRTPQTLHQDVTGVQDLSETGDRFGDSLAVGNFNGDAFNDLAVGVPYEDYPLGGGASWDDVGAGYASALRASARRLRPRSARPRRSRRPSRPSRSRTIRWPRGPSS